VNIMAVLWKAREADVRIGNSLGSVAATDLYDQITGTQYEDIARNLTIKLPEAGTEIVQLLGETGGAQNEILDPKRKTKGELTLTILPGNKDTNQWFVQASGTAPAGFTRYNFGNAEPTTDPAVAVRLDDGGTPGDRVNFLMNNSKMVSAGEIELDAEGFATQEIKFECTAADFFMEEDIGN